MRENDVHTSRTIVLDIGRRKRKAMVRKLEQRTGPLADEIRKVAEAASEQQGGGSKEVVPVVILYRKRARRPRGLIGELLRRL